MGGVSTHRMGIDARAGGAAVTQHHAPRGTPRPQDATHPAGLKNLGNTCYANSAFQFLAAVPEFRRVGTPARPPACSKTALPGAPTPRQQHPCQLALVPTPTPPPPPPRLQALYGVEESLLAHHPVLGGARDLLLQMEFGQRSYADPTAFAASLQLDHTIQQDGQVGGCTPQGRRQGAAAGVCQGRRGSGSAAPPRCGHGGRGPGGGGGGARPRPTAQPPPLP